MGSVAIEHWGVLVADLTRMVKHNDLSNEATGLLGGVVLAVRGDISTTDVLDGNVFDIEANIVSGNSLFKLFVMHLNGFYFSGDANGGEGNNHAGFEDTGFYTANRHCADTRDLVDILEGETEGLV
jgi:hypothetical protein